ncbi:hypothetical protein GOODEAATRI_033592 [Goodea atripinnis]|uniref:Uncharacterized protein n=1 Tax=Goodea atripinnis TaxID=208336 RepID=A0ABV0PJ54_9TELE
MCIIIKTSKYYIYIKSFNLSHSTVVDFSYQSGREDNSLTRERPDFVFISLFKGIQRLKTLSLSLVRGAEPRTKFTNSIYTSMWMLSQLRRVLKYGPQTLPGSEETKLFMRAPTYHPLRYNTSGSVNHKTLLIMNLEPISSK